MDHQSLVESTPEIQFTIQISEATRFAILVCQSLSLLVVVLLKDMSVS